MGGVTVMILLVIIRINACIRDYPQAVNIHPQAGMRKGGTAGTLRLPGALKATISQATGTNKDMRRVLGGGGSRGGVGGGGERPRLARTS